ncbi:MAG: hypothetical protein V8S58_15445 [Lachnospiraceae bacterium]
MSLFLWKVVVATHPEQTQHSCDLTVLRSDARLAEVEIRNLTTEDELR